MMTNEIEWVSLVSDYSSASSTLRAAIARVLGECEPQLSLVFSVQEVVRRLLFVCHSSDPVARSLTLLALASIAPCVPENKQVF